MEKATRTSSNKELPVLRLCSQLFSCFAHCRNNNYCLLGAYPSADASAASRDQTLNQIGLLLSIKRFLICFWATEWHWSHSKVNWEGVLGNWGCRRIICTNSVFFSNKTSLRVMPVLIKAEQYEESLKIGSRSWCLPIKRLRHENQLFKLYFYDHQVCDRSVFSLLSYQLVATYSLERDELSIICILYFYDER